VYKQIAVTSHMCVWFWNPRTQGIWVGVPMLIWLFRLFPCLLAYLQVKAL